MNKFFDAAPPKNWKKRDKQTEIEVDYRLCYECMGSGHDADRQYLAQKYNTEIKSVGDLQSLGYDLFNRLTPAQKKANKLDAEKKLSEAAADLGRKGGSAKSERKASSSRENGKKGGRPKKLYDVEWVDEDGINQQQTGLTLDAADKKSDMLSKLLCTEIRIIER